MTPGRASASAAGWLLIFVPLFLLACPDEEELPTFFCDDIECGSNASCDEELELCVCHAGYEMVDGQCLNTKTVACRDEAPSNATSVEEDVEIVWSEADGWAEPPACEWSCDSDFDQVEDACLDVRLVECNDAAPENASSNVEEVEITFSDAGGWTDPRDCDWSCDEGFGEHEGACVSSRMVPCRDVAPANATSDVHDVSIEWDEDNGVWMEPASCPWFCDAGYGEHEGQCLESVEVTCLDAPPANAQTTDDSILVTIEWDGESWADPEPCPWECAIGYHEEDGICLENVPIDFCMIEHPHEVGTTINTPTEFFGRVRDEDALTGENEPLAGITAKWCFGPALLTIPVDLEELECMPAEFNGPNEGCDEYMIEHSFDSPGEFEYVFAFSGDGGLSWTSCFVTESGSPREGEPGLAVIVHDDE